MPKYEMMYIVASSISDDQIPSVTDGILKLIGEMGGSVLKEEKLGKKKLAYPIAKTRNGFYDVVTFELEGAKLNELNTKVLNTEGIIRHIIVNIEDMLVRMSKDAEAQAKMNKNRAERAKATQHAPVGEKGSAITDENLDEKIEQALSEDLKKI